MSQARDVIHLLTHLAQAFSNFNHLTTRLLFHEMAYSYEHAKNFISYIMTKFQNHKSLKNLRENRQKFEEQGYIACSHASNDSEELGFVPQEQLYKCVEKDDTTIEMRTGKRLQV